MPLVKWLASMECGHVWGDETVDWPSIGEVHFCFPCGEDRVIEDVVTNQPETLEGRSW